MNSLAELPTLKEFEELGRLALSDAEENLLPVASNEQQPEQAQNLEIKPEIEEGRQEVNA